MAIPVAYNLRNLVVRKTTTIMTALGIALTVAVLLAVLALVNGLRTTLASSGDPLQIVVMRKGSESEIVSNFTRTQFQDLKFKPGIATGANGQPLASLEVITVINLSSTDTGEGTNVTVRGLQPAGIEMRRGVKLASGRWFQEGKRELVVGKTAADRYPEVQIGRKIRFGRGDWEIVGVMDAGRGAQASEIWGDLNQVASDLQRLEVLSSALVRATDPVTAKALANDINNDQRLNMNAVSEEDYYAAADGIGGAHRIHRNLRGHHHGGGQRVRGHEYDVRGGGAALARNRHAARSGLFQGQHPVQLLPGIGAAFRAGRRAGVPAGAAFERHHHGNRQFQFLGDGVQFPRVSRNHDGRDRIRGDSGRGRRTVSGEQRGAKRDPDGAAGGLIDYLWMRN